jgi:hypothetical protein
MKMTLNLLNYGGVPACYSGRYLGFSPDGGDHSFEVLLLVAVVTLFGALGLRLSSIGKINDGVRKKTRNRFFRGL